MSDEYQNGPYNRFSTPDKLTTLTKERDTLAAKVRELEATIAACKEAGFVDENGNVRKVLGTLPVTADGCVVGIGDSVWNCDQWSNHAKVLYREDSGYGAVFHTQWRPIEVCYSTRSAAEKARRDEEAK